MRIDQPRIFGGMRDSNNQLGIANSVLISTGSEILWSSVNAAPGTIGGSIAANQVAYGSGSDAIQGSNNLTFDGTLFGLTGNLSVSGITTLQSTTIHLGVSSFASYIRDSRNQQGSPGQVLSATTTGVAWTTAGANYNNGFLNQPFSAVISTTVTHNFGSYPVVDVLDINNKVIVPEEITHNSVNDFIVVFETISTGVIIASNAAPVGIITGTVTGNLNATGFVTSVGFFGPGTNLTNLNASNLDTGTVPSARLTGTYSGITSLGVLTQLRVTGASTFTGQVFDSENRAGLAGSVLSSTGAGISWINPTSSLLTGIVSAAIGSTSILPTDTILQGIQKAQGHFNLFNTSVGAARYRNYTHDFDHNTRYFTSATDGSAIIDQIGLASHPGILTITIGTSTAFPQTRFAWGGPSGTYKPFMIDDFTRITWVFRYNLYASNEGWFGIYGISCFNSENQNNTICAFFNNTSLFLRAQSSTGVITQINTGVTLTANAWYKMDLVRNSANSVSLIVNDSTMTTLSTSAMPFGTSCGVGGRMMTTQLTPSLATARSFDLDYLQMIFEPLGSRF